MNDIPTLEELFKAYFDCRKHKRNTINALKFEENVEYNLINLYDELTTDTYRPGKSICFVATHPKHREIWAADFKDRVVHHLLYNKIKDRYYKRFIFDTFACIPEKGVHKASSRMEYMIKSCSENYTKPTWFLKMDIKSFFVSINKNILLSLLEKNVTEPFYLNLVKIVLYNDPTNNFGLKGDVKLFEKIPKHKSLFHAPENTGLPIGNLSSQFFANVYLNELDQFIKRNLKCKYYARYADDFVILNNDKKLLNDIIPSIDSFLQNKLHLSLQHDKTQIGKIEDGLDFVGFIHLPYRKYIRKSTVKNAKRRIEENIDNIEALLSSFASYHGMLIHCNSYKIRQELEKFLFETYKKD